VDFKQTGIRRHVDHIVPARLIRRLKAGNPDRRENLQCICGTCHGYKLQADHKLCMGDKLGYLEILRTHNFDLGRVGRLTTIDVVIVPSQKLFVGPMRVGSRQTQLNSMKRIITPTVVVIVAEGLTNL
jgi:hypothetical protein